MNMQPIDKFQHGTVGAGAPIELEQAVIGCCLLTPDAIPKAAARLTEDDFAHPVHRLIIGHLFALSQEGRTPSIQAIAALFGSDEIEPGLTARAYCGSIMRNLPLYHSAHIDDAVETLVDHRNRERLFEIGSHLQSASLMGARIVSDIASDAVRDLDDIMSSTRKGKATRYGPREAADAALRALGGDGPSLVTTGLDDLDRLIGGFPKGELSIIAGRPGMGKSAVVTSTIVRAARKGNNILAFMLEMQDRQLGARLLTDLAYVAADPIAYQDILQARVASDRHKRRLMDVKAELDNLPITFEEQRSITVAEIASRSRKLANTLYQRGKALDAIFVDHIGLVTPSSRYSGIRHREIAETTNALATLAKELGCAVVALSQINRGVEGRDDKRPTLSDLKDSGSIEEDASNVTFIYRPSYYLDLHGPHEDPNLEMKRQAMIEATRNTIEFIVSKNRNGACGSVRAFADMRANAIRNGSFGR